MAETERLDRFLDHCSREGRERLRGLFKPLALERGQFIFIEGDPASTLYVVEEGAIEVSIVHQDGRPYIFHFLAPGDVLGLSAVYGQDTFLFSTTVRRDVALWRIEKRDLLSFLETDETLEKHLLYLVGERLDQAYIKDRCIVGERVEKRVVCVLLKSAHEKGIHPNCLRMPDFPLTNRDIAGLVGSTEETISRIMSRLKKRGILGIVDRQPAVLDHEALTRHLKTICGMILLSPFAPL